MAETSQDFRLLLRKLLHGLSVVRRLDSTPTVRLLPRCRAFTSSNIRIATPSRYISPVFGSRKAGTFDIDGLCDALAVGGRDHHRLLGFDFLPAVSWVVHEVLGSALRWRRSLMLNVTAATPNSGSWVNGCWTYSGAFAFPSST
jgi:hypothetical protein